MSIVQLKPVAIYLSGPMLDHTGDFHSEEAKTWREELARWAPTGVLFVSPAHAFFGAGPLTAPVLDTVERYMMNACHGVLANMLNPDDRPFGTVRDIEFARNQLNKPVAIAGQIDSLMAHDVLVADTLEDALTALLQEIRGNQDSERPDGLYIHIHGADGHTDDEEFDEGQ